MLKSSILVFSLLVSSLSFGQKVEMYRLSSREADSIAAHNGGNIQLMADTSFELNRVFNKSERDNKRLPKEVKGFRLMTTTVATEYENGKQVFVFTHTYNWFMKTQFLTQVNKIVVDSTENPFSISRDEAISKLKESKELLDLEIISQKEYDEIKSKYTPFIIK